MWFEAKRDTSEEVKVGENEVDAAIEAFSRSEGNTVGYIAASFAPILILLSTIEYYDGLNDKISNQLITTIVLLLGFAGTYYSVYKVILLTFPRILLEGFKMKLIHGVMFKIFPSGIWKTINIAALTCIIGGYLSLFALILRRLWF